MEASRQPHPPATLPLEKALEYRQGDRVGSTAGLNILNRKVSCPC